MLNGISCSLGQLVTINGTEQEGGSSNISAGKAQGLAEIHSGSNRQGIGIKGICIVLKFHVESGKASETLSATYEGQTVIFPFEPVYKAAGTFLNMTRVLSLALMSTWYRSWGVQPKTEVGSLSFRC